MAGMQFTWWPKQLEKYGYKISDHCDWNHLVVDENSYEESRRLSSDVPEKVADSVTVSGNVDECIALASLLETSRGHMRGLMTWTFPLSSRKPLPGSRVI